MAVKQSSWGQADAESHQAHLYHITNASGASLVLSDFGARVVQMNIPVATGDTIDVVLGFDSIDDYRRSNCYIGGTVGRFANRISQGRFRLDGVVFQVDCNEGSHVLHGGRQGFDRHFWSADFEASGNQVRFNYLSVDGDQGFPGNLDVSVTYGLTDKNTVRVEMCATTDQVTLCNLAHHSYFNLAGHDAGSIANHYLQIDADFYTPVDSQNLTTGEVLSVEGTVFDFRQLKAIGKDFNYPELKNGYDHNWCLRGERNHLRPVARIKNPDSGLEMKVSTNECGIQLYTGGFLDASIAGKGGAEYQPFSGFALETQNFPNAPIFGHMPTSCLSPGERYIHIVEFQFLT